MRLSIVLAFLCFVVNIQAQNSNHTLTPTHNFKQEFNNTFSDQNYLIPTQSFIFPTSNDGSFVLSKNYNYNVRLPKLPNFFWTKRIGQETVNTNSLLCPYKRKGQDYWQLSQSSLKPVNVIQQTTTATATIVVLHLLSEIQNK